MVACSHHTATNCQLILHSNCQLMRQGQQPSPTTSRCRTHGHHHVPDQKVPIVICETQAVACESGWVASNLCVEFENCCAVALPARLTLCRDSPAGILSETPDPTAPSNIRRRGATAVAQPHRRFSLAAESSAPHKTQKTHSAKRAQIYTVTRAARTELGQDSAPAADATAYPETQRRRWTQDIGWEAQSTNGKTVTHLS